MNAIKNLEIVDMCNSDHFPITFNYIFHDNNLRSNRTVSINDITSIPFCKLNWYINDHEKYMYSWRSDKVCDIISVVKHNVQEGNINQAISSFQNALYNVYGSRRITSPSSNYIKKEVDNWYDNECKQFKHIVNRALRTYRASGSPSDRDSFCEARRNYNALLRKKKHNFFDITARQIIDAARLKDSKRFWSFFKNTKHISNSITDQEWYDYFKSVFDVRVDDIILDIDFNDFNNYEIDGMNRNIDFDEVDDAIKCLKNGKACGMDGVSPEIIKTAPNNVIQTMHDLFQKCFTLGIFPDQWRVGLIHPVYKKGDKKSPSSYRPISLLCITNKIFIRILNNRLCCWLNDSEILSQAQAGFRKEYCTIDNCFVIHTAISKALRSPRGKLYAAFIDLKAAFDNIDRNILFHKLIQIGVKGRLLKIVYDMYRDVRSRVKCNSGLLSTEFGCTTGVRQGDNLSPILFSLYMNDLEDVLNNCTYPGITINKRNICCLQYADDLVIFSYNAYSLQKLLNEFENYCKLNKLRINKDKSKIIVFRKGGYLAKHEKWILDGSKMDVVNQYNYLGIAFTPKGVWYSAQNNLSSSASKAIFSLKSVLNNLPGLPVSNILHIFDSKILPILTYGAEVWGIAPRDSVTMVYNRFHKYILGLPFRATNILALGELGRPSFKYFTYLKQVSYWLKISMHDCKRYTKLSFLEQISFADMNYQSWGLDSRNYFVIWVLGTYGLIRV